MKNFNFSLFFALYIFLVGWYFTRAGGNLQMFLVFALAMSPLLWLAFYVQGRRVGGFRESRLKSYSFFAHFTTLACSVLLMLFIKSMGDTKLGPVQFFNDLLIGWNYRSGLKLLALVIVLVASAAVIWSGFGLVDVKKDFYRGKGPRIFFAGFSEAFRFPLYLYFTAFLWALGFFAVMATCKRTEVGSPERFTIVSARAMLPLVALVPVAILRLRIMAPASLLAAAGVFYLMLINSDVKVALLFVGPPLVAAFLFIAVRYANVPACAPADGPDSQPAAPAQDSAQTENIQKEPGNG